MYDTERETLNMAFFALCSANMRYLKEKVFRPYFKMLCMRMILFYQRRLSRHTCMFRPTCSQYTLECINNHGVFFGILLGIFRILRCHPWAEAGKYDPAPENYLKKRWLL